MYYPIYLFTAWNNLNILIRGLETLYFFDLPKLEGIKPICLRDCYRIAEMRDYVAEKIVTLGDDLILDENYACDPLQKLVRELKK